MTSTDLIQFRRIFILSIYRDPLYVYSDGNGTRQFRACGGSHMVRYLTARASWFCHVHKLQITASTAIPLYNPLQPRHFLQFFFSKSISTQQVYASNVEIGVLSRAGNIEAARHLFDKMPHRDIVTWNTIITAFWKSGLIDESKSLFELMPKRNVVSWNSIIAGCVENDRIDDACRYFDKMPTRNTASWNAMISGFVKYDRIEEAAKLFEEMPRRNVISYTALMDGYAQKGEVERARYLFDQIPERNAVSWTVMIRGYVSSGKFEEAKGLYNMLPKKNVIVITAMITGYCKEGKMKDARMLFDQISDSEKDIVSWNAMIAGYAQNGNGEESLRLHLQMREMGLELDHATFVSLLTACSSLASIEDGRQTHVFVVKEGFEWRTSVCNAMITMYSKCGEMRDSERLFAQLDIPDLVSWNTIIASYAQFGHYEKAMNSFHKMESVRLKPDGITFLSILSCCGHTGRVEESMHWFSSMINDYGITPRAEHYACLVDILSRAGKLQTAHQTILEMPFKADAGVWGSLLVACQVYKDVQLGELAASELMQMDPRNSGTYITLSNIYAAFGMWSEVTRVRGMMKEQGIKKQPGYSWTVFENKVHLFLGGDISHSAIDEIHLELGRISRQMKRVDNSGDLLIEHLKNCFS